MGMIGWFKRIFFFMLVNVAVVFTVNVLLHVFGVRPYLNAYGMDFEQLAYFCLIWGMAGSFISLLLSRWMAKRMMGVQVVDPRTRDPELQQLVQTVHNLARGAGLGTMPEVGIYDSPEVNAFATGPSRRHALVAVSTGLLSRMNRDQVEGVLGHEIAHVANGDMVTMTLVQGVVNAFVLFLSKALAFVIAQSLRSNERESRGGGNYFVQFMIEQVLYFVFMFGGMMVVAWFSRYREFRADAGGARLAGRDSMVSALRGLQRLYDPEVQAQENAEHGALAAFKISGGRGGLMALLSTHPPLDERIARLEGARTVAA